MCGRYALYGERPLRKNEVRQALYPLLADIRPSQKVPVLTADDEREMQWWYVPGYAKDPKEFRRKYTTFNARVETLTTNRTYKGAWEHNRRCLFPLRGYYEWQSIPGQNTKQRYWIHPAGGEMVYAAGLWERWQRDKEELESATMIVGDAIDDLKHIHARTPKLIPQSLMEDWFLASLDDAMGILLAAPHMPLEAMAVAGPIILESTV